HHRAFRLEPIAATSLSARDYCGGGSIPPKRYIVEDAVDVHSPVERNAGVRERLPDYLHQRRGIGGADFRRRGLSLTVANGRAPTADSVSSGRSKNRDHARC